MLKIPFLTKNKEVDRNFSVIERYVNRLELSVAGDESTPTPTTASKLLFFDDFAGTDHSAAWIHPLGGTFVVSGGDLTKSSLGTEFLIYEHGSTFADGSVSVRKLNNYVTYAGAAIRMNAAGDGYGAVMGLVNGLQVVRLYRYDDGAGTLLDTFTASNIASTPHVRRITIEATGTSVSVFADIWDAQISAMVNTVDDAAILTGDASQYASGYAGVVMTSNVSAIGSFGVEYDFPF